MMFDPVSLGLLGAAVGGLTSKKPLKGALLGGALGAGGGLLAGGMGGASGASGLLGNPMTAASYGTNLGSQQTAMLAAQEAGMGSMPVSGSLMGYLKDAQPAASAMRDAVVASQAFSGPEEPMIAPPQLPQQTGGQALQSLAQGPQFDAGREAEMRKKRRMGLLGGMA